MKIRRPLRQYRWQLLATMLGVFAAAVLLYQALSGDQPTAPDNASLSVLPLPQAVNKEPAGEAGNAVTVDAPVVDGVAPPAANPLDIFAVRNWEPPAPAVAIAADMPPPPPEAPPIPFRYAGKLEEAGKASIFYLTQGEEILVVRPGEVIKGDYRVGKIKDGQLYFLYRPLKIQQSIPVGGDT